MTLNEPKLGKSLWRANTQTKLLIRSQLFPNGLLFDLLTVNKTISIRLCAEVFTSATKYNYYTLSTCNYTTLG